MFPGTEEDFQPSFCYKILKVFLHLEHFFLFQTRKNLTSQHFQKLSFCHSQKVDSFYGFNSTHGHIPRVVAINSERYLPF